MDVPAVRRRIGGHRAVARYQSALTAAFILALPISARAADYIGAAQCKACHPTQYAGQSQSAHARALFQTTQHPLRSEFSAVTTGKRAANFSCIFDVTPKGLRARMEGQNQSQETILEWAFGAGSQGITFVGKRPGQTYLEFSLSFYSHAKAFGITPGHERIEPVNATQALGIPFATYSHGGEIIECFQCHSTGPVSVAPDDSIEPAEPGVRCEVCHGPGSAHRDAAANGPRAKLASSIENPGRLSSMELNRLCGRCHRFLSRDRAQIDLTFAWNVRHQPPYLEKSICFRKSEGRLSCLTCHSPHELAKRNKPEFYNAKCATCHASTIKGARVCTTKQTDCVGCHMPLVSPSKYMQFRSHWIGVYAPSPTSPSTRFAPPRS